MRQPIAIGFAVLFSFLASPALACEAGAPEVNDGLIKFKFVICALAGQSAVLMKEVRKEMIDQGVRTTEVSCTSTTLGSDFRDVGTIRIPPYNCKIGDKYLMLNGDVLTYDNRGRAGPRPRRSRYLVVANPKWSWR